VASLSGQLVHGSESRSRPPGRPDARAGLDFVRVVTWNLCCSTTERSTRLAQAAHVLGETQADVVLLQEVWQGAAETLASALGMNVASASEIEECGPGHVAILSRYCIVTSAGGPLPGVGDSGQVTSFAYCVADVGLSMPWVFYSAHLAWGSHSETARLKQARALERQARDLDVTFTDAVHVLGGDLNTQSDSRTVRYLTGLEPAEESSAFWVDAWSTVGKGPGYTSDPSLPLARESAQAVGITAPELLPYRRIDYILTRGYAHGRAGCPIDAWLVEGAGASDHHGVSADLWLGTRLS
jgi:endonuclease/exonuclease/phosphatase family metal-dependent hydrolase